LHAEGQDVHGEVDRREERGLRAAISEARLHDLGLLEIEKRRADREQQDEPADIDEVGRAERVGDAGNDAAVDRPAVG